jgi:hypothetical protein
MLTRTGGRRIGTLYAFLTGREKCGLVEVENVSAYQFCIR